VPRSEYERWIAALQPQVIRAWLWKHTKSLRVAEAEELIQEIKTRLLEVGEATLRDWQSEEAVRKYASGVAAHVGIDWLRQHTRASAMSSNADVHELADERQNPERQAIAYEQLQQLLEALRRMPKQRRRVITLLKVYQYSIQEVAERLDMQESTVKTHLRRATKRCVVQLQGKNASEATHLLARLLNCIQLGKGRRPSGRRKLIDPTE
jgi:RNA polymerase sigma factor (sigma-70 family)